MFTVSNIFKEFVFSKFTKVTIYCVFITGLVSCKSITVSQDTATVIASTPQVQVTLSPPMTIAPTLVCKPVLGVNLDAVLLSSRSIDVKVSGLQPNEHVTFVFYSEVAGKTFKIESNPLQGANANGTIEYTEYGLDKAFKEWQIQVVHSRGIACTAINLP